MRAIPAWPFPHPEFDSPVGARHARDPSQDTPLQIEIHTLRQWQILAPVDRIRLTSHVSFPGI
jgi:hypothetical protein